MNLGGARRNLDRLAPREGFVRNVGSLWSAQVGTIAIAAVQGLLVARILGPSGFGAAALIVAFAGVMYSIVDARSSDASMKYLGGYIAHAKYKEALAMARLTYAVDLGVSVGALALVALTSGWASQHLVGGSEPAALFVVMGLGYAARFPVATSQSILLTMGRFVLVGHLQVGVTLARSGLVIALVAAGAGVAGLVFGTALGFALEGVLMGLIALRETRRAWAGSVLAARSADLGERRGEIGRFLGWSNYGTLVGILAKEGGTLFLGFLAGPTQVGYFKLATSLVAAGGTIAAPLQSVAFTRFSRQAEQADLRPLRENVRRAAFFVGLPLGAVGLAGIALVPTAIHLLAGQAYAPSVVTAQVLLIGVAVWVALFWLRPLMLSLGEVRYLAMNATIGSLLALAGFILLAPGLGAVGIAWAQTGSVIVTHGLALERYRHGHLSSGGHADISTDRAAAVAVARELQDDLVE